MSRFFIFSVLCMAGLLGCVPQVINGTNVPTMNPSAASPTETSLPDLIVSYTYLEIKGRTENCITAGSGMGYEVRVVVKNIGTAPAGPFEIEFNGMRQRFVGQLPPDQIQVFQFSDIQPGQAYVDVTNLVAEVDENNNSYQYLSVTPTPVLLCTPTPTPVS
jgi:hypothetical protein